MNDENTIALLDEKIERLEAALRKISQQTPGGDWDDDCGYCMRMIKIAEDALDRG